MLYPIKVASSVGLTAFKSSLSLIIYSKDRYGLNRADNDIKSPLCCGINGVGYAA